MQFCLSHAEGLGDNLILVIVQNAITSVPIDLVSKNNSYTCKLNL